jgi:flagellin
MRINNNISSMVTQGALYKVTMEQSKSLEKLSTGMRINRASDDAAGLGVSENLRTQVRGTNQAVKNANDGIAAINIAEGSAAEISEILQRMREISIQSSNDTLTATERAYTNQEFTSLISEIDRIAKVTNYNGMALLSETTTGGRFGAGSTGSSLWIDANSVYGSDSITITIDTLSTNTTSGIKVADLNLSFQSNAVQAVATLDMAIDSVNSMRSDMGAFINRLEHAINNLTISNTNQQAAESLIRDVDFATETSKFTRSQILTQSATAMLSQANMLPQGMLKLIGG